MKNDRILLNSILLSFIFLIACEGEKMWVETGEASEILSTTAKISGEIKCIGDGIKKYGHCYAKNPNPTIFDTRTEYGLAIGLGGYTSFLQGLEPGTKYYTKAYISRNNTTAYGSEVIFTTEEDTPPEITTYAVTDITQSSAVSGRNITSNGGIPVTSRGVCWSISARPTIADNKTTDGSGSGPFSSDLTGLTSNTTYYLRAYATKSTGTTYGNEFSFTTTL
jgi:hypothetical protein